MIDISFLNNQKKLISLVISNSEGFVKIIIVYSIAGSNKRIFMVFL